MNFHTFSDEGIDLDEIAGLSQTLPFLGEYRILLIRDSGFFKGTAPEQALKLMEELPSFAVLIFVEKQAERSNSLYQYIRKNGELTLCETAESKAGKEKSAGKSEVRAWARDKLKAAGRRIDSRSLFSLVEMTGYDMQNLSNELEKLISYTLERPEGSLITAEDISAVCSVTLSDRVFEMADLSWRGDTRGALRILEELFAMRTPAMRILYFLARQYYRALEVKECMGRQLSEAQTASAAGITAWQAEKLMKVLQQTDPAALSARLEAIAEAEYRIKKGDLPDRLALELFLAG